MPLHTLLFMLPNACDLTMRGVFLLINDVPERQCPWQFRCFVDSWPITPLAGPPLAPGSSKALSRSLDGPLGSEVEVCMSLRAFAVCCGP